MSDKQYNGGGVIRIHKVFVKTIDKIVASGYDGSESGTLGHRVFTMVPSSSGGAMERFEKRSLQSEVKRRTQSRIIFATKKEFLYVAP